VDLREPTRSPRKKKESLYGSVKKGKNRVTDGTKCHKSVKLRREGFGPSRPRAAKKG